MLGIIPKIDVDHRAIEDVGAQVRTGRVLRWNNDAAITAGISRGTVTDVVIDPVSAVVGLQRTICHVKDTLGHVKAPAVLTRYS